MHMPSDAVEAQLEEDVKKHQATLTGTAKEKQAGFWLVLMCFC